MEPKNKKPAIQVKVKSSSQKPKSIFDDAESTVSDEVTTKTQSNNKTQYNAFKKQTTKKLSKPAKAILIFMGVFVVLFVFVFLGETNEEESPDTSSITSGSETTTESNGDATIPQEGVVLLDDSFVEVRVRSVEKFPSFVNGVLVTFSVYNKSQQNLDVLTADIYVNGVKLAAYGFGANSGTIEPGKTGLMNFPFSYDKAFVNSYEELKTMQVSFNVMDHESIDKQYTSAPTTFDLVVS